VHPYSPHMQQTLPWIIALAALALLAVLLAIWMLRTRTRKPAPLPTEWTLAARPVFSTDERRVYRQLREALPHHIVLSKLPLVRFCQPTDPQQVHYWFDLLGAIHVTFAVCSANGRVLAAMDLDTDRGNSRRVLQIKQAVLAACRVRYLRCPVDHLPSIPELQLLVPQNTAAARAPQSPPVADGLRRGAAPPRTFGPVAGLGLLPGFVLRSGAPVRFGRSQRVRQHRQHPAQRSVGARDRRAATRRRKSRQRPPAAHPPLNGQRMRLACTMSDPESVYSGLTPATVLDALDAVGFRGDGRILQLNSYENRVFQLMLEDGGAVVAKFYRPLRWSDEQIVEEHRFAIELAQAEVPVVAPCLLSTTTEGVTLLPEPGPATLARRGAARDAHRWSVSPRSAGRAPELEDDAVLMRLGGFIGRLHAVGARRAFGFRRTLDAPHDARESIAMLDRGGFVSENQREPWAAACALALECIDAAFGAEPANAIRLHGDCHPGNLLWRDEGAHVVDLDDACMGPAVQDLWMLLSGEPESMAHQLRQLLRGYAPFMDFDRRQLRLIEPLRLLRMIRHNAWVAQRWADPAFPRAFPDFGSSGWWGQQALQLREQVRAAADTPTLDSLL
jgi:Ser/Thr protein kinase RdoA (MazF antagonist)